MKKNLNADLSKLTGIDNTTLLKLSDIVSYIIGNSVYESSLQFDDITEIDLGFGELLIKNDNGNIKTKFIPSEDLELDIKGVVKGDKPMLKKRLEHSLAAKLIEIYKDII